MDWMRCRTAGALVLAAALLAGAGQPATAQGETRRRGAERDAGRGARAGAGDRLDDAVEAAERAGVDRRDVRSLTELCVRGGFSEEQSARIFSLAAQLALEELPVESFAAKLGEGVSKRIEPGRILQAAERRALLLQRAKNLLNAILLAGAPVRDREELIPDVAAALEAGRSAEELRGELAAGFDAGESVGEIRRRIFP